MKHEHIITVDQSKCNRCGLCIKDCPAGIYTMTDQGAQLLSQKCIKCTHCFAICPTNAITVDGFKDPASEVQHDKRLSSDDLLYALKSRRSIRHFRPEDVPNDLIAKIIEAGRYTPTARNAQGVSYVVLKKHKDDYEKIAVSLFRRLQQLPSPLGKRLKKYEIDDNFFFKSAPVAIVIKANTILDGALAASNMEIMAQSLGLGVLYSGYFTRAARYSSKLTKKLALQKGDELVTTLVIGYPDVKYQRTALKERPSIQFD